MATKKDNNLGKEIKVRKQENTTPSVTEMSIIGGIDKIVTAIADDFNTALISLITGDIRKRKSGDVRNVTMSKDKTLFAKVSSISEVAKELKSSVESIKEAFYNNSSNSILFNIYQLLDEFKNSVTKDENKEFRRY